MEGPQQLPFAKGILFDLDGTLLDFEGAAQLCLNSALTSTVHSLLKTTSPVSWQMHASIIGQKGTLWSETILNLLQVPATVLTPAQYVENWHADLEQHYPAMELMPGALELVKTFKAQGKKLAIATSSERSGMIMKMSHHRALLDLMDAVVTGD